MRGRFTFRQAVNSQPVLHSHPSLWHRGCGVSRGPTGQDEICPSLARSARCQKSWDVESAVRTLVLRLLPTLSIPGLWDGRLCLPASRERARGPWAKPPALFPPPPGSDAALCCPRSVVLPAAEAADLAEQLHQQHGHILPAAVSGFGGVRAGAVRRAAGAVLVCGRRGHGGVRDPAAGETRAM